MIMARATAGRVFNLLHGVTLRLQEWLDFCLAPTPIYSKSIDSSDLDNG